MTTQVDFPAHMVGLTTVLTSAFYLATFFWIFVRSYIAIFRTRMQVQKCVGFCWCRDHFLTMHPIMNMAKNHAFLAPFLKNKKQAPNGTKH